MIFSDYPLRGIDVSQFNDNLGTVAKPDLNKAKASGCKFVIFRTGYGQVKDKLFDHYYSTSKGLMDRAAYHYLDYYSHPYVGLTSSQWGVRQAQTVWSLIKDDPVRVFIDVENASSSIARPMLEVWGTVVTILDNFLRTLDVLSGKETGIYCSTSTLSHLYSYHKGRPLWVANYNPISVDSLRAKVAAAGFTNLKIWQYQSNGDVDGDGIGDGIRLGMDYKTLDLNIWLNTVDNYGKFFGVPVVTPPAPVEPTDAEKLKRLWDAHPELH